MELKKEHVEIKLGIRNKKEFEINKTGLRVTFDSILTCATRGISYVVTVMKRKPPIYGILFISLDLTVIAIRSFLQREKSINSCTRDSDPNCGSDELQIAAVFSH